MKEAEAGMSNTHNIITPPTATSATTAGPAVAPADNTARLLLLSPVLLALFFLPLLLLLLHLPLPLPLPLAPQLLLSLLTAS